MNKDFYIGQKVKVITLPPYLKTAEPMPMLRPPDMISLGEEGIILDRKPGNFWAVRFQRGAFLLDSQYIDKFEENHQ
jgi:Protein of unknown function (DUF3148)